MVVTQNRAREATHEIHLGERQGTDPIIALRAVLRAASEDVPARNCNEALLLRSQVLPRSLQYPSFGAARSSEGLMITTEASKYLLQMGLDPLLVVSCAAEKVSELLRPGEWICRRGSYRRGAHHCLLLLGLLLPERNSPVLLSEGMMKRAQVCDHCGRRFGMVTYRWWGSKFCRRICKEAYLREVALGRDRIIRSYGFLRDSWFSRKVPT